MSVVVVVSVLVMMVSVGIGLATSEMLIGCWTGASVVNALVGSHFTN